MLIRTALVVLGAFVIAGGLCWLNLAVCVSFHDAEKHPWLQVLPTALPLFVGLAVIASALSAP